jgi:transcriptional regulator with XRE-family HTH domain
MERNKRKKQTIGDKLKALRLELDLTFGEVAARVGIAAPTVYRLENNLAKPSERTLYKLNKAFPGLVTNTL